MRNVSGRNHMMASTVKKTTLGLVALAMFGLLTGCATVPTSARTNVSSKTIAYFLRPGQGPTVVFQSGLGDGKAVWAKVIERMPESASIFAYDRPGYGDSLGAFEARNPCAISRELRELLRSAGLAPPYLLVGHSLGGLYQFCYAKLFPQDVAGLVLLDPTHPNHWARMKNDAVVQAAMIKSLRIAAFSHVMRQEFDDQAGCIDELDMSMPLALPAMLLFSSQFQLAERGAFEKMARALRDEWLVLFSNGQHSEVRGSGHYIQKEAPDAVVGAIQSVVAKSKVSMIELAAGY
jgi:pimeloyl-ACP methyl ester carboxylesterase